MPITGQGILPAGAAGTELIAMTRRAFVPKVIVQLYKQTPLLSAMLASGELISGGVSPITVPVQGTKMVTTQATDYSGSFTAPQVQTGLQNAEFNLKAYVTPIPYYVMEGLAQIDAAVIPILEARMNDAGNNIADTLAGDFYTASTSALHTWSLADIVATANPARANFGGIDRVANTWWQSNLKSAGTSVTPTRSNMIQWIMSAVKSAGGEMPTMGIASLGTWASLAQDFAGQERYVVTPESAFDEKEGGARALFTALSVAGVPFYADPYAVDGQFYLLLPTYLGVKIHRDAAFAVAGPESLLPNYQLGYIMVLVLLLELICSKPAAQTVVTGFSFLTL